ncbi:ubiquitin-protein ligase [Moniliophthora roreri]|nr:ubiquitin-protein ligase [Moniliophthora roreri]
MNARPEHAFLVVTIVPTLYFSSSDFVFYAALDVSTSIVH